ncbi:MAG: hypothetical protein A2Y69_10545 [Candidatus Aminicenantes bacterium RBG_13_59_9]|nr:MAG: hypothetical protein A2Y69_10545 [Candidatus Aminicenantes bacterium RBG_13_59_9]
MGLALSSQIRAEYKWLQKICQKEALSGRRMRTGIFIENLSGSADIPRLSNSSPEKCRAQSAGFYSDNQPAVVYLTDKTWRSS